MVTKKQLAALAYGRKIRKAQLAKRKQKKMAYKRSKKNTKFNFQEFGETLKTISEVAGNFIKPFSVVATGLETGSKLKKAFNTFFEDDNKIDTDQMQIIIGNMKNKLIHKNPDYENHPVFEKLSDISKNLLYINMLKKDGQNDEAKKEIKNTLYLFSRIVEDYTKLMNK